MLSYDKASEIMLSVESTAATEMIPLLESAGRVIAEPVLARMSLPPFSKAAMDGFALSAADESDTYSIIETIPAGIPPKLDVGHGTCSRIMTGAMMPAGADAVVRVEYTREEAGVMRIETPETGRNVIEQGENVQSGAVVFEPGVIEPRHIGIFAEQGIASLPVCVPPLIGIINTGTELKNPGEELQSGEIYNSNGPQLCAQISAAGWEYRYYGSVTDEPKALASALASSVEECDVVILTGGVSMGEFDYVPPAVQDIGAEILFHKVAVKPGKPLLFARFGKKHIVGLPGNPVSTYIIFEVMIKPMIYRLMGVEAIPTPVMGRLACEVTRRDERRTEFRPVFVSGEWIEPLTYHGSSHLQALGRANALLKIDRGISRLQKGQEVHVRPI